MVEDLHTKNWERTISAYNATWDREICTATQSSAGKKEGFLFSKPHRAFAEQLEQTRVNEKKTS